MIVSRIAFASLAILILGAGCKGTTTTANDVRPAKVSANEVRPTAAAASGFATHLTAVCQVQRGELDASALPGSKWTPDATKMKTYRAAMVHPGDRTKTLPRPQDTQFGQDMIAARKACPALEPVMKGLMEVSPDDRCDYFAKRIPQALEACGGAVAGPEMSAMVHMMVNDPTNQASDHRLRRVPAPRGGR